MDNKKIFLGMFWRFAERCGAQGVKFIVELVLARLLFPEDYGTVTLIAIIIAILQVFVDSGLGSALIQKKDADDLDFSTVFYINILFCIVLYAVICILAPWIAGFYSRPEMVSYIRVLGITILISGVKNVQQAYVSRNMLFKRFFFSTLGGTIVAAAIGIWMAYHSFGTWALVVQQVVNNLIDTLILWVTVKWRPSKKFSISRLKRLYSFGWKLLISALLDTAYNNICALLIGKAYSSSDLAYYNQGEKFPKLFAGNINTAIDSVLLPVMSNVQEDCECVKNLTRRSIKMGIYIMAPVMLGLVFAAEPLIRFMFTEKWLPCVPFFRIFCVSYAFYPIHAANLNAMKALGRSDLFLKLEILKKTLGIAVLFFTVWFGVKAIAYGGLLTSIACMAINTWPNKKLLDYGYWEQLKDILPSIFLAVIMGILVSCVSFMGLSDILTLMVQAALGISAYILGSVVLELDSFRYLYSTIRKILLRM